jgi:hypothetical protein
MDGFAGTQTVYMLADYCHGRHGQACEVHWDTAKPEYLELKDDNASEASPEGENIGFRAMSLVRRFTKSTGPALHVSQYGSTARLRLVATDDQVLSPPRPTVKSRSSKRSGPPWRNKLKLLASPRHRIPTEPCSDLRKQDRQEDKPPGTIGLPQAGKIMTAGSIPSFCGCGNPEAIMKSIWASLVGL